MISKSFKCPNQSVDSYTRPFRVRGGQRPEKTSETARCQDDGRGGRYARREADPKPRRPDERSSSGAEVRANGGRAGGHKDESHKADSPVSSDDRCGESLRPCR